MDIEATGRKRVLTTKYGLKSVIWKNLEGWHKMGEGAFSGPLYVCHFATPAGRLSAARLAENAAGANA
jgi:hypothetical protein